MLEPRRLLILIAVCLACFIGGLSSRFSRTVKADSGDNAQIEVREVTGGSSLVVYYPNLKKLFVYQSPFVGMPTWGCSYSVQLSTPGGPIKREPCATQ